MKRLFALVLCAITLAYAIAACGGGGDAVASDKLTIVGSGT
jgi:hypothetical protein